MGLQQLSDYILFALAANCHSTNITQINIVNTYVGIINCFSILIVSIQILFTLFGKKWQIVFILVVFFAWMKVGVMPELHEP